MSEKRDRGEESLPVFDAIEEVEVARPPRPGSTVPRALGPARGAGIAAAALVLLIGGIAVGSLPRDGDPVRSDGAPHATASSRPSIETVVAGPCRPKSALEYAGLTLSALGVPYQVDGLAAAAFTLDKPPAEGISWLVPSESSGLHVAEGQPLGLTADPDSCVDRLAVTYARVVDVPANVSATSLFDETFDPPIRGLNLGEVPVGDWVLWVEAQYETDQPGAADLVTVSFFRVIVGGGPAVTDPPLVTPEPSPVATPIVPCGTTPATDGIVVTLSSRLAGAVPGIGDFIPPAGPDVPPEIPELQVGPGDPVQVDIADAVCAVSWEIRLMDPSSGLGGVVYHASNPNDDPRRAAQNHWEIPIQGEQLVVATLHFAGGPTITRSWHVVPAPFQVPKAFLVAADGTRFQASAGCGLSVILANGFASDDGCGVIGYLPDEAGLEVHPYEPVTFEIPGWSLQSWYAICGTVPNDGSETFRNDAGCRLGGATSDSGDPLAQPAVFVLPRGEIIVRIFATGLGANGDQFSVPYFAHVIVR